MSAEKCIVEWKPKEDIMTEEVLISRNIDYTSAINNIKVIYALICKQELDNISMISSPQSEYMPGPAYKMASLGINDNRYDSFHLYIKCNSISLSIYKHGNSTEVYSTEEIGIDWDLLKCKIKNTLEILYKSKYAIILSNVFINQYNKNEWNYKISCILKQL